MKKIDWTKKLSSRKFWMAMVGFVSSIMIAFNVDSGTAEQITAIIMSGGTLIAYILAEGFIDANNVNTEVDTNENK